MSPVSPRTGENRPCDFCNQQIAVLYCRADTAKLCLFCDQLVHSANALSKKHLRSQICDNCGSVPASILCATDNLVLCQECDLDAHGSCAVSGAHDRTPVEGFSGCPSASNLASAWGLDIEAKKPPQLPSMQPASKPTLNGFLEYPSWMCKDVPLSILLQDLMVPCANNSGIYFTTASGREVGRNQTPTCGKQKHVILKQLIELFKRDLEDGGGVGSENLGPKTPNGSSDWQGNVNLTYGSDAVMGGVTQKQQQPQNVPFTSLIMPHNPKDSDQMVENILWSGNFYDQNIQNSSNNRVASQGPATSESNNSPRIKTSSDSGYVKTKCCGVSTDLNFMDQSIVVEGENIGAETLKADMELLAKNRGNAMQRYKEKKKMRRYEKHIRYESRKARADTRKRVKGRFVKASDAPDG